MTINDIEKHRRKAVNILIKESQYETARAVGEVFDFMLFVKKYGKFPSWFH